MSRFTVTVLSLLLFCQGFATNHYVTNPGSNNDIQPNIQAKVNIAVNGDVIILPAGIFKLNKSVVITNFISIKGAGTYSTILYRDATTPDDTLSLSSAWDGMFRFNINSTTNSNIIVSDFWIKSKVPSMVNGDGLSRAADIGIKMIQCKNFIITRCRFDNFGNGAISVYHDDVTVGGLICNNVFYHNVKGQDGLGLGYGVVIYGQNLQWVADPQFGTSNFIFVEDNYFTYHRHSIAAGGNALYVFRYNVVEDNVAANTAHAIDAHDKSTDPGSVPGTSNYYATRAIEVYKNSIINTLFKDGDGSGGGNPVNGTTIVPGYDIGYLVEACIRPRGGEALIHHNYIKGYRFGVGPYTPYCACTYPYAYQSGYLSGVTYGSKHTGTSGNRGSGDLFIWADTFHVYNASDPGNVYFWNYGYSGSDTVLKWERDYHMYAKSPYTTYTYPHPLKSIIPSPAVINEEPGVETAAGFEVRPNPNNGIFGLHLRSTKENTYNIIVHNSAGKLILQKKIAVSIGEYSTSLDLSQYGKGIYFISLAEDKTSVRRIVVQ